MVASLDIFAVMMNIHTERNKKKIHHEGVRTICLNLNLLACCISMKDRLPWNDVTVERIANNILVYHLPSQLKCVQFRSNLYECVACDIKVP